MLQAMLNQTASRNNGANILNGNDGNDDITVGSNDTANGGNGNDYIHFNGDGNATINGENGDDTISAKWSNKHHYSWRKWQ